MAERETDVKDIRIVVAGVECGPPYVIEDTDPNPTCPACGRNSSGGGRVLVCSCGYSAPMVTVTTP